MITKRMVTLLPVLAVLLGGVGCTQIQQFLPKRKVRVHPHIVVLSDTLFIGEPDKYLAASDSVLTYQDAHYQHVAGAVPLYGIVYPLKHSADGSQVLIATKPLHELPKGLAGAQGWIGRQFVRPIEKGLCIDPMIPLFDNTASFILNVNGNPIYRPQFDSIAQTLKRISVSFIFCGTEASLKQFPSIANAIQTLQPLFEADDGFKYQVTMAQELPRLSVEKAATNLLVLLGTNSDLDAHLDSVLLHKLADNNCRIVGVQLYAGEDDSFNNFVLSLEKMIRYYAGSQLETKKSLMVSPKQVKHGNSFVPAALQVDARDNVFHLDFPANSVTQGFVCFPQKNQSLSMDVLTGSIRTIIEQIKADNNSLLDQLTQAFADFGTNKIRFSPEFIRACQLDSARVPDRRLVTKFSNTEILYLIP